MKSKTIKITNPIYLHAHMIKQITVEAGKYTSDIYIVAAGEQGNAKSLVKHVLQQDLSKRYGNLKNGVSLMSVLGRVKLPCKIDIRANGWDDDEKAVEAIANIFGH